MLILGTVLFALAFFCAWPLPAILSRYTLKVEPGTLIILWQATGLAGGLSLIGALGFVALAPLSAHATVREFSATHWAMLAIAVLVLARLLWCMAVQILRTRKWRKRHLAKLHIVSRPLGTRSNTRVLDSTDIVAYCIPGRARTTVVSTGMLARLPAPARASLLAHERAHVDQHHDLVILPFAAWQRALPFLPATTLAFTCVTTLIEFLADDAARTTHPGSDLVTALQAMGESTPLTRARLDRLQLPPPACTHRTTALVGSAVIVLAPAVALLAVGGFF